MRTYFSSDSSRENCDFVLAILTYSTHCPLCWVRNKISTHKHGHFKKKKVENLVNSQDFHLCSSFGQGKEPAVRGAGGIYPFSHQPPTQFT